MYMKSSEIVAKFPQFKKNVEEKAINVMDVVTDYFFHKKSSKDYRKDSIEFCVGEKQNFCSTGNVIHEMAQKFVVIKCPTCGRDMKVMSGGGSSGNWTVNYVCEDDHTKFNLSLFPDGLEVKFPEKKDA